MQSDIKIRKEVLVRELETGIVEFLDPLLQMKYALTKEESSLFLSGDFTPAFEERLSDFMVLEGFG